MINSLEKLAAWLLFSLSVLFVYGFLSLFFIGPSHAVTLCGYGDDGPDDPYGGCLSEEHTLTMYTPMVFSESQAMWKLFDGQLYSTLEDCRAVLPNKKLADNNAKCIAMSGEKPND